MRVRVSTRGVRTSIGPRAARVHFGSGRTGISTGVGPFYAYQSLGGGRNRRRTGHPTPAQIQRSIRAAERQQKIDERNAEIHRLISYRAASVSAHLEVFPRAACPTVPPPPHLVADQFRGEARRHRLASIPMFDRAARADAKRQADIDAAAYCASEQQRLNQVCHQLVDGAGAWWRRLSNNDEATVCEAVNAAFADNAAAGCMVGVEGDSGSIIMRQPDLDTLPERMPSLTSAGNPTLRALSKRDRLAWWYDMLLSNVAATLLEGFATAPGLQGLHLAVITRMPGSRELGVVLFGTWTRADVGRVSWTTTGDAVRVLDVATELSSASVAGIPNATVRVVVGESLEYADPRGLALPGCAPGAELHLHELPPNVDRVRIILCDLRFRGEAVGYITAPNGHLQAWRFPPTLDGDIMVAEFRRQVATWWAKTDSSTM